MRGLAASKHSKFFKTMNPLIKDFLLSANFLVEEAPESEELRPSLLFLNHNLVRQLSANSEKKPAPPSFSKVFSETRGPSVYKIPEPEQEPEDLDTEQPRDRLVEIFLKFKRINESKD